MGANLGRSRFKLAIGDAMRTVAEANKYLSEQAPWKLRETDPARMETILHTALQVVDDAKTLLTPFLPIHPSRSSRCWAARAPGPACRRSGKWTRTAARPTR